MMDFLNNTFGDKSVVEYIHSLMTETNVRDPLTEESGKMRASGIFDGCPREEALFSLFNIQKKEVVGEKLWKVFRFGRVFETFFRDDLLGKAKLVIGKWECVACGFIPEKKESPRYARPDVCEICGCESLKYVEETLTSEEYGISGHPDGFLHWGRDYYILELKTANSFNFAKVQAESMPRHVAQVQVYMHLTGYRKAIIWYFNKDTAEDVVHEVRYDPDYALRLLRKGLELKHWFRTKQMPSRICPNSMCARARRCQVSKLCFT
jgi:hypothetical protein